MKKSSFILFLGMLAILIPGTILKMIAPGMVVPNLLAVVLVYLAFYEPNVRGAILAFALGFELDLCSGVLLGPWAGAYVLVFALLVLSSQRVFIESAFVIVIGVFIASFLTVSLHHLILALVHDEINYEWSILFDTILEAALGAIIAPFLFYFFRRKIANKTLVGISKYQIVKK